MRRPALGAVVVLAALLALAVTGTPGARADGDPASDVLLGQDVFLPYSPMSPTRESSVYAIAAASHRAGYPLKLALIASRADLGVVPALFGKPQAYARFLSSELSGAVTGPVLVVMPSGFGLAAGGNALSTGALTGIPIAPGADGLAAAALAATVRLARAAGHPLPAGAAEAQTTLGGADAGTIRHALVAILVLAALAAMAAAAGLATRARRSSLEGPAR